MKKNHIIYLFLIMLLGFILRILFLDKPEGLWNDEYVSWMIAKVPFDSGFWGYMNTQNHMPFYYLYLKGFMAIFGDNDNILRLSSVIPAVFSIPVMYFVGKLKNNFCAVTCSIFTAISPFLIYYSQEVRFYSILFLFSALTFLFVKKSVEVPSKFNFTCFIIASSLVLFTHTIGFVYIFAILIYFFRESKCEKKIKNLTITFFIILLLISLPFVLKALTLNSISQWWGKFSITSVVYLFTDYFSPVLTNFTNALPKLTLDHTSKDISQYLPAFIAICMILKSKNIKLNLVVLFVIISMLIASYIGKLVFTTKYSIEIYPILIYLFACGLDTIKNRIFKGILIFLFFVLNIFYYPPSFFLERSEGNKLATNMIGYQQLKNEDTLILLYYDKKRFEKYIDLNNLNIVEFTKSDVANYIDEFSDLSYPKIYNELNNKLLNTKKGSRIAVLSLNSVSFIPEETLYKYYLEKKDVSKQYYVHSYVRNGVVKYIDSYYLKLNDYTNGSWNLKIYEK